MGNHVCPVWVGYLLVSPLRKLLHNPTRILGSYISEGMKALDIGAAMGFFSIPLARMVGASGKVICVDVQPTMIAKLKKRAQKAGVAERIETRVCAPDSLDLKDLAGQIDFALAFAIVHEVPDASRFFFEVHECLQEERMLLLAEPTGRVTQKAFAASVLAAEQSGLAIVNHPRIRGTYAVLFRKQR